MASALGAPRAPSSSAVASTASVPRDLEAYDRAAGLLRAGRFDEAAEWGLKASARPNAHPHVQAIAAYSLALAGRLDEARARLGVIHTTLPRYGIDDFLTAMKFSADGEAFFRKAATRI